MENFDRHLREIAGKTSDRRERIATQVLAGLVARVYDRDAPEGVGDQIDIARADELCEFAVRVADRMIAALKTVDSPPPATAPTGHRLAAAEPAEARQKRVMPNVQSRGGL